MKRFLILAPLLTVLSPPTGLAEVENDLTLGIEAVTGLRSDYVYRGFHLAGTTLDFQAEAELALTNDTFLSLGGWLAAEVGGEFSELSGMADLSHNLDERFTLGATLAYRSFQETFFRSGVDLGPYLTFRPTDDWAFTVGAYRDFGASSWYAHAEALWSRRLTDDAFLDVRGGVSVVDGYYERSGFNDFYGRASLTYNVNRIVSLTPFLGWSLELLDGDGSEVLGGLWFEVSF